MSAAFDYFNQVASRWDQLQNQYFGDDIRNRLLDCVKVDRHMCVADIGTGTGYLALPLARICKKVIAIDASSGMLSEARRKAREAQVENVRFILGNVYNLPVDSNKVDMVFSNMMLHHVVHPDRAIKEMARILKKGGKLYITDVYRHPGEWVRKELEDYWLGFDSRDIREWYREAGLSNIAVRNLGCQCRAVSSQGEKLEVQVFVAEGTK